MNRRQFVVATSASLLAPSLLAHHGWSSFDEAKPLYFVGTVKSVKWQNPHAELVIEVAKDATLPADLAKRAVPKQTQNVDGAKVMANAALPKHRGEWTLELSPLTRIDAWKVAQPKVGDKVAAVGYTFKDEKMHDGKHLSRIEYFIVGDSIYGLRSMPDAG
ncbi:MAG: DUF6152 family protein [Pseudomonadota bacterium]